MKAYDRFKTLDVYFGAYLHQDWMYEFADPAEAYETLLREFGPQDLRALADQFDAVLALPDAEVHELMRDLSPYLDAAQDLKITEREWLQSLRARAAEELQRRQVHGR